MSTMDKLGDADCAGLPNGASLSLSTNQNHYYGPSTQPHRLSPAEHGAPERRAPGLPAPGRDRSARCPVHQQARRQVEFQSLLDDCRINPQHLSENEKRLDALLNEADNAVTVAMLRQDTRLKAAGGYRFIAARSSALAQYKDQLESQIDRQDAELQAAAQRLLATGLHPARSAVRDIVSETHDCMRDSLRLREQYAEVLAASGRSGKALSLIIQRKDMERSLAVYLESAGL